MDGTRQPQHKCALCWSTERQLERQQFTLSPFQQPCTAYVCTDGCRDTATRRWLNTNRDTVREILRHVRDPNAMQTATTVLLNSLSVYSVPDEIAAKLGELRNQ